ncbi:uncharacterized protein LOC128729080 [Anopheles nili]|uniref:uncharacterized protein LOC128729080 n=1 Tax=Anopheles nili TaxID=185578 RepID=UPI00237AA57C|nr:uncharacterized protein LOC128729080 [Anopheles nili]
MVVQKHGVALIALWISWTSVLSGMVSKECVIEVTQDMAKHLVDSKQNDVPCDSLWNSLLLHVYYAQKNLTECLTRDNAVLNTPEPSLNDCQQQLQNSKQNMEHERQIYSIEMQKKLHVTQLDIRKYVRDTSEVQSSLLKVNHDIKSFHKELLFLSIDEGDSKRAIKYYHLYLENQHLGNLFDNIVESVYRDPAKENARLMKLLEFVKKLPGTSLKLSMYNLVKTKIMKRPQQRDGYLGMVTALDVSKIAFAENLHEQAHSLYLELFNLALNSLRNEIALGHYDEVIAFATSFPEYFEQVENRFSTMDKDVWHRADFNKFVTYPNQLPLPKQRLEAFRMILLQINQRNRQNFADRLTKVAKELDACETFIKTVRYEQADQDKLTSVKQLFSELDANRDYNHYREASLRL